MGAYGMAQARYGCLWHGTGQVWVPMAWHRPGKGAYGMAQARYGCLWHGTGQVRVPMEVWAWRVWQVRDLMCVGGEYPRSPPMNL